MNWLPLKWLKSQVEHSNWIVQTTMNYLLYKHKINWLNARSHWQIIQFQTYLFINEKKCVFGLLQWSTGLIRLLKSAVSITLLSSSLNSHPFLENEELWYFFYFIYFIFFLTFSHLTRFEAFIWNEVNLKQSILTSVIIILNGAAKKFSRCQHGNDHQHFTVIWYGFYLKCFFYFYFFI